MADLENFTKLDSDSDSDCDSDSDSDDFDDDSEDDFDSGPFFTGQYSRSPLSKPNATKPPQAQPPAYPSLDFESDLRPLALGMVSHYRDLLYTLRWTVPNPIANPETYPLQAFLIDMARNIRTCMYMRQSGRLSAVGELNWRHREVLARAAFELFAGRLNDEKADKVCRVILMFLVDMDYLECDWYRKAEGIRHLERADELLRLEVVYVNDMTWSSWLAFTGEKDPMSEAEKDPMSEGEWDN